MENFPDFASQAIDFAWKIGPGLIAAIITLIVGLWVIKFIGSLLTKALERSKVEVSLQHFLSSLVTVLLKVMLLISVASMLGINTTSFVAIIGAAGLAVGLALQGSLANFAGGVLILLFKPYKVGDFIEAQGFAGSVKEIQIFNTILKTGDNKIIIIPNGPLAGGNIINYSTMPTRRVDMTFGIGYDDDLKKAKEVLQRLVKEDSRILSDPEPMIAVSELADSSVNFTVRVWCQSGDYWGIFFDMQEKVKLTFDQEKLSIPYPQQDVHVYNH